MDGEFYTVPAGLAVHCVVCSATLEAGAICWVEHDDSSSILCVACMTKRQNQAKPGPTEFKDEDLERAAQWMEFD